MSAPTWDGLPRPSSDVAVLYALGAGFGESQVMVWPDGKTLVVDSCKQDGTCLPSSLLDWLGIERPDLFAVTHPDLDHIDGLDELVAAHLPRRLWRYPGWADVGEYVAQWLDDKPDADGRLRALRNALTALEKLEEPTSGVVSQGVQYGWRDWPATGAPRVSCLAPPGGDLSRASRPLHDIVEWDTVTREPKLNTRLREYLLGDRKRLDRNGNRLSLALTVHWADRRLLLAGDVENSEHDGCGWRGVLEALEEDDLLYLVTDLTAMKVAHHGSNGAFNGDVWALSAKSERVRVALLSRFDRGHNPPPHVEALAKLKRHGERLALTSRSARTDKQVVSSGWNHPTGTHVSGSACCAAVSLPREGPIELHLSGGAGAWRRSRP